MGQEPPCGGKTAFGVQSHCFGVGAKLLLVGGGKNLRGRNCWFLLGGKFWFWRKKCQLWGVNSLPWGAAAFWGAKWLGGHTSCSGGVSPMLGGWGACRMAAWGLGVPLILPPPQHCTCQDDCSSSNCLCGQLSIRCWYDKVRGGPPKPCHVWGGPRNCHHSLGTPPTLLLQVGSPSKLPLGSPLQHSWFSREFPQITELPLRTTVVSQGAP